MKYQCVVWQLSLIAVFVASSRAEGRGQRAGGYEFIINSLTFFNFKLQFKHPDNRYVFWKRLHSMVQTCISIALLECSLFQ